MTLGNSNLKPYCSSIGSVIKEKNSTYIFLYSFCIFTQSGCLFFLGYLLPDTWTNWSNRWSLWTMTINPYVTDTRCWDVAMTSLFEIKIWYWVRLLNLPCLELLLLLEDLNWKTSGRGFLKVRISMYSQMFLNIMTLVSILLSSPSWKLMSAPFFFAWLP